MISLLLSTPSFYVYLAFLVVLLLAALCVETPRRLRRLRRIIRSGRCARWRFPAAANPRLAPYRYRDIVLTAGRPRFQIFCAFDQGHIAVRTLEDPQIREAVEIRN